MIQSVVYFQPCYVAEVVKRSGVTVSLISSCEAVAFLAAAIVPVPALRIMSLQAAILVATNFAYVILYVFPAIVSLDVKRRISNRADILCCLPLTILVNQDETVPMQQRSSSELTSSGTSRTFSPTEERWVGVSPLQQSPSMESLTTSNQDFEPEHQSNWLRNLAECGGWSMKRFVKDIYAPSLTNGCTKTFVVIGFLILRILACGWGLNKLEFGLNLTDIVAKETAESKFFEAQQKHFGHYNMFAITHGNFEYPKNQILLEEYHESFNRIPWIIKNDDGGLADSWLTVFRSWLLGKNYL